MKKKKKGIWLFGVYFHYLQNDPYYLVQINFPKKGIKEKKLFSQIVKIQNGIEL